MQANTSVPAVTVTVGTQRGVWARFWEALRVSLGAVYC
jgi:hypothetical protein